MYKYNYFMFAFSLCLTGADHCQEQGEKKKEKKKTIKKASGINERLATESLAVQSRITMVTRKYN